MTTFFTTLSPDWNIPNIKAYTVLAKGLDSSIVSFSHQNLFSIECRQKLEELVKPTYPINWLWQVHGNRIVELPVQSDVLIEADGGYTTNKRTVCAVITADCLPIVFSNQSGTQVGVVHAGRKGLQKDIILEMIKTFKDSIEEINVWLGPGIAAGSYPVSSEIREEVLAISLAYEKVFTKVEDGHYLMDLYEVAKMQLLSQGILKSRISGAEWNTFTDMRFHSARRDKDLSGRMATVVWIE